MGVQNHPDCRGPAGHSQVWTQLPTHIPNAGRDRTLYRRHHHTVLTRFPSLAYPFKPTTPS